MSPRHTPLHTIDIDWVLVLLLKPELHITSLHLKVTKSHDVGWCTQSYSTYGINDDIYDGINYSINDGNGSALMFPLRQPLVIRRGGADFLHILFSRENWHVVSPVHSALCTRADPTILTTRDSQRTRLARELFISYVLYFDVSICAQ